MELNRFNFISKHLKSEFLRNVLTLFSGAMIAQVIPFIAAPVLARMYMPEQFGELGVILSITGIFGIISTFQYEAAIMLPKDDEDAFSLLSLSMLITIAISVLSYIVTSLFSNTIASMLGTDSFKKWMFIIPAFVFLTGTYNSLNIWASRKKQFKRLAVRQFTQSSVQAGAKLVLGWLKYLNGGLILGTVAGQVTSTGVLAGMTVKDGRGLFKSVTLQRMKANAIRYQNFPKYTMWQGFIDLFSTGSIIFILTYFYGMKVVGYYSFTIGLLQKPSQMIGTAVSQVFYQNASSKVARNESIHENTRRLIKNLAFVGVFIYTPFFLGGYYIFNFVFSSKWNEAGLIAQIISPWLFFSFIGAPLANIAVIKDKQKQFLFITIGMNLMLPTVLFAVGKLHVNDLIAFGIISLLNVGYVLFLIGWIMRLIKNDSNTLANESEQKIEV
jgi:O-antigen/teichoic acid export membrane protein